MWTLCEPYLHKAIIKNEKSYFVRLFQLGTLTFSASYYFIKEEFFPRKILFSYRLGLTSKKIEHIFFLIIVAAISIIEMLDLKLQKQMMCATCTFRNLSTGK